MAGQQKASRLFISTPDMIIEGNRRQVFEKTARFFY